MHRSKTMALFDHLVGATRAASAAQSRPSALAVLRLIAELVLGRRLHRQIGRLLALENTVDVAGGASVTDLNYRRRRRSGLPLSTNKRLK